MQVWTSEETLGLYLEITYMYTVIVGSMARLEAKKPKVGHKSRERRGESSSLGTTHMLSSVKGRENNRPGVV